VARLSRHVNRPGQSFRCLIQRHQILSPVPEAPGGKDQRDLLPRQELLRAPGIGDHPAIGHAVVVPEALQHPRRRSHDLRGMCQPALHLSPISVPGFRRRGLPDTLPPGEHTGVRNRHRRRIPWKRCVDRLVQVYDVRLETRIEIEQPLAGLLHIIPGLFHPGEPIPALVQLKQGNRASLTPLFGIGMPSHGGDRHLDPFRCQGAGQLQGEGPHTPHRVSTHEHPANPRLGNH
jgi:hypothetical protein